MALSKQGGLASPNKYLKNASRFTPPSMKQVCVLEPIDEALRAVHRRVRFPLHLGQEPPQSGSFHHLYNRHEILNPIKTLTNRRAENVIGIGYSLIGNSLNEVRSLKVKESRDVGHGFFAFLNLEGGWFFFLRGFIYIANLRYNCNIYDSV
ncbi:ACT domain repeat 3 [Striga asiatica]|uniref:ACT domain repeat 3 n=1 Tax=Striga asiatica TaxID=4170 RepID=A0A5A7QP99_STRAF|nr:ACT domain repeat 3 [Striga asiatica]